MHTVDRSEYSALSDRMAALLMLRLAMHIDVAGWALLRSAGPWHRPPATARCQRRVRRGRRHRRVGAPDLQAARLNVTVMLLIDGLYLAWAMYASRAAPRARSASCSISTSSRCRCWRHIAPDRSRCGTRSCCSSCCTGRPRSFPAVDVIGGTATEFERDAVPQRHVVLALRPGDVGVLGQNERELRHRRADLQTIVDIGARLDDMSDPIRQSVTVLEGLAERFGFQRGVVTGASDDQTIILASIGAIDVPTIAFRPDAIVARAWERREHPGGARVRSRPSTPSSPRSRPGLATSSIAPT